MTQATRKLTFEEYLSLDAEDWVKLGLPEGRCEYRDGEVVELPPESRQNLRIANYLFLLLVKAGIPFDLIYSHACELEVSGKPRTRYPDLVLLREEHLALTQRRATVTLKMPPPEMVVEVVSPGEQNHERDYEAKRKQYQKRGIPEFWVINPQEETVLVLELNDEQYLEIGTFQGKDPIRSSVLKALNLELSAAEIFAAGR